MVALSETFPFLPFSLDEVWRWLFGARPTSRILLPADWEPLCALSRPVLAATSRDDLHARLDALIPLLRTAKLPAQEYSALKAQMAALNKGIEEPGADSPGAQRLGLAAAAAALRVVHGLRRSMLLLERLEHDTDGTRKALTRRALAVTPWSLQEGNIVPHALVRLSAGWWRTVPAMGAFATMLADGRKPEPWLPLGLLEEAGAGLEAVAQIFWMAGHPIDEDPLLPSWPSQGSSGPLEALFCEVEAADAAFVRAMTEDIQAGRLGLPDDE